MNDTLTDRPSGWHSINIGHLVMGIAFLGIVGVWALIQSDTVTGDDIHWLMPIPWVVAGVVGLVATAITGPRRYAVRQTGWVGEQPTTSDLSAVEETATDEAAVDETAAQETAVDETAAQETATHETAPLTTQKPNDEETS